MSQLLSVIKNPKGVYGFIKTGDGNYYYDTTSLQKGTFLKVGAKVNLEYLSQVLQPRVETLGDIPGQIDFIENVLDYTPELYNNKKMKTDAAVAGNTLAEARKVLENVSDWDNDSLFAALKNAAEQLGVKNGQILYPLRIALSGKETTPGGATEIASVLGREETLRRIDDALAKL